LRLRTAASERCFGDVPTRPAGARTGDQPFWVIAYPDPERAEYERGIRGDVAGRCHFCGSTDLAEIDDSIVKDGWRHIAPQAERRRDTWRSSG
jgi:hypothetical protein